MSDKKKPMLHEILAVEVDAQGVANKIIPETIKTFKDKATHFNASRRSLKLFAGGNDEAATLAAEKAEETHVEMVTTVHAKLQYTLEQVGRFYDIVLQKEATNQDAVADIVLPDGTVFAAAMPVGFLLGMESKLKLLRGVYEEIPTLAPGIIWVPDTTAGPHVYRVDQPEVRVKTAKEPRHKILVPATDKHPAQIEKWEETVNVGAFTKESWSSMMTTTEKSQLLGRLDDLIQATKQARMRANTTPVRQITVASALTKYLHPNGF
jgi:hypothetical protein